MAKACGKRDTQREKYWREIIRRREESGIAAREFCRRNDINWGNYIHWKGKINKRNRVRINGATGGAFTEVRVVGNLPGKGAKTAVVTNCHFADDNSESGADCPIEVILPGGCNLLVRPGFDAETLRRLVEILEGAPC